MSNTKLPEKGTLTISLDLELYWGVLDSLNLDDYYQHIAGVRQVIPALLELFAQYEVHVTWATVGFLHYDSLQQLKGNIPQSQPSYQNLELSPYSYIAALESESKNELHFCPDLIDLIRQYPHQEIATHTYSHYYCLESGQTKQEFQADISAAIKVAKAKEIATKSLVFPRNQFNQNYLAVLKESGILCYRGNPTSPIYNSKAGDGDRPKKKLLRLLDNYTNISGQNCYDWAELGTEYPINIPASSFLRPYAKKLRYLDGLRLHRITSALDHAANNDLIYHLWWHPHNFGVNLEENLDFLGKVLKHYQGLKAQGKMQSLSMVEIAEQCLGSYPALSQPLPASITK